MNKNVMWKRIAAFGLTAAMLVTSVSAGFAAEESTVPEELSEISTFGEETEAPVVEEVLEIEGEEPADAEENLYFEDSENEEVEIREDAGEDGEMEFGSLIEDMDVLTASEDEQVVLTLNPNGGHWWNEDTEPMPYYVSRNEEVYSYQLSTPEQTGKICVGWATDAAGSNKVIYEDPDSDEYYSYSFDKDTTLYAVWEACATYTLNPNGGYWWGNKEETGTKERKIKKGRPVAYWTFSEPEKDDMILAGWATDAAGKNVVLPVDFEDEDTVKITAGDDMTLYAVWTESVTFTLDPNGGYWWNEEETGTRTQKVKKGSVLYYHSLSTPTNEENKVFGGWATDAAGTNIVLTTKYNDEALSTLTANSDMTLYAVWEEAAVITLDPNGGHWYDDDVNPKTRSVRIGEWIDAEYLSEPEHDEKMFGGWATDAEGTDIVLPYEWDEDDRMPEIQVEGDMELYAVWKDAAIITLDPNGGYWYDEDDEEPRTEKYTPGTNVEIWDFSRPHHAQKAFVGWATDKAGTDIVLSFEHDEDNDDVLSITVDGNMTLYAVWDNAYTVTFDPNGGYWEKYTGDGSGYDTELRNDKFAQNSEIECGNLDEPEHSTKLFKGWATDKAGSNIVLSWMVDGKHKYKLTGNVKLYAVWADPVTITLVGNGGKAENDDGEYTEDKVIYKWAKGTRFDDLGSWRFRKEGYILSGWKAGTTTYKPDDSFVVNGDTTIVAQWAKKVTVTWDLKGGTLKWRDLDPEEDPGIYVDIYAQGDELPSFEPEKDNYAFMGWSTTDGSDVLYMDRYNSKDLKAQNDMTLYAVWAEAYTVTFNGNGGVYYDYDGEKSSVTQTIPKNQSIGQYGYPVFRYPVDDGLKAFSHWALDANDEEQLGWNDPITKDMEVYAIWVPGVMVTFDLNGGNSYGSLSFSQVIEKDIIIGDHFYYGTGITPPAGKTFVGWSLKRNDTSSKISTYKLTQNVTLFALWKASAVKPSVPTDKITISKAPSGVKAKAAKKGKATLTWKKFKQTKKTKATWKKIKKIEVQYSTDKNFKTGVISKTLPKKKTKLTVKKLKAKTTYYFRVRYVEGPYKVSKWSSKKKVKAKK